MEMQKFQITFIHVINTFGLKMFKKNSLYKSAGAWQRIGTKVGMWKKVKKEVINESIIVLMWRKERISW